jgi:hypothetical protein
MSSNCLCPSNNYLKASGGKSQVVVPSYGQIGYQNKFSNNILGDSSHVSPYMQLSYAYQFNGQNHPAESGYLLLKKAYTQQPPIAPYSSRITQ